MVRSLGTASRDALLRVSQACNQSVSQAVFQPGAALLHQAHVVVQNSVPAVVGLRASDTSTSFSHVPAMLDTHIRAAPISRPAGDARALSLLLSLLLALSLSSAKESHIP